MRSDMGRVVIERPRSGSSNRSLKLRRVGRIFEDEDGYDYDGPGRVPNSGSRMRAIHYKIGEKEFTDLLGPIDGYLQSSIGRKWDDVYSEIARNLGAFSWPLQHIVRDHIHVDVNTWLGVDGKIYADGKHGTECVSDNRYSFRYDFYVHPITRVLCMAGCARRTPRKPERRETDRVRISGDRWYVLNKGIWFIGLYRKSALLCVERTARRGHVYYADLAWPDFQVRYGNDHGAYIFTLVKQANSKELRKLRELQAK